MKVTRWQGPQAPTEAELRASLKNENLSPYSWHNGPGDRYSAHQHLYNKVIYVVSGVITFHLASDGDIRLEAGDRLDLPAEVWHSATVGPQGVACLEAHRSANG